MGVGGAGVSCGAGAGVGSGAGVGAGRGSGVVARGGGCDAGSGAAGLLRLVRGRGARTGGATAPGWLYETVRVTMRPSARRTRLRWR